MATKKELNEKYFTQEGIGFIETKIKTMINLCNENKFPINVQVLGFGILKIEDKEEIVGRIIELCELIGYQIEIKEENDRYFIK